jgi:hypothetical protein
MRDWRLWMAGVFCTVLYVRNTQLMLESEWAFEQMRRITGAIPQIMSVPSPRGGTLGDHLMQDKMSILRVEDGTVVCALAKDPVGWGTRY